MLRSGRSAAEAAAHGVCPVPRVGASCGGVDGLPVRTDAVEVYGQLIHNDLHSSPGNRGRARVRLTKPNANGSGRSPKRKLRSRKSKGFDHDTGAAKQQHLGPTTSIPGPPTMGSGMPALTKNKDDNNGKRPSMSHE